MKEDSQRLLLITTILACAGIVMVYSASSCYAYDRYFDSAFYLKRHIVHFITGAVLGFFVFRFDYRRLKPYAKTFMLLSIICLLVVFIPRLGHEAGGARRWIKAGPFTFQPSEVASLFLIIYLAAALERKHWYIRNFLYGFLPPLIASGIVISLVLIQPDLGSSIALLLVVFVMVFSAGANLLHFMPFIFISMPAFYFLVLRVPYRLRRIVGYLDPWSDPHGAGFQIVQSFLALGSGGLFGVGLGLSRQKLFYLPQAHTDFIFSIIGEELGLMGSISIVVLFILFIWYGIKISLSSRDLFGKFLALGITSAIGIRAFINIAVSTGLIPTKGLPLPFISYGGTALIINMVSVALLLNISER